MYKAVRALRAKRPAKLTVAALVTACLALSVAPAHATEASTGPIGPFLTGSGDFYLAPGVGPNSLVVFFECSATAWPDASSTSVRPASEGGCVLTKGGVEVARAAGATYPGPAAFTSSVATVSLDAPGRLEVCWQVSARYVLNGGLELWNSGCTE